MVDDKAMTTNDNRATWQQVLGRVAEYSDTDHWNRWKGIALPILRQSVDLELDSLFRAGMGMHQLIFSTVDHHRLKDEPRVTFEIREDWTIRISLARSNVYFNEPSDFAIVDEALAFSTFRQYLRRLWEQTQEEPIPSGLSLP